MINRLSTEQLRNLIRKALQKTNTVLPPHFSINHHYLIFSAQKKNSTEQFRANTQQP